MESDLHVTNRRRQTEAAASLATPLQTNNPVVPYGRLSLILDRSSVENNNNSSVSMSLVAATFTMQATKASKPPSTPTSSRDQNEPEQSSSSAPLSTPSAPTKKRSAVSQPANSTQAQKRSRYQLRSQGPLKEVDGNRDCHVLTTTKKKKKKKENARDLVLVECSVCESSFTQESFPPTAESSRCTHPQQTCQDCWHSWLEAQVESTSIDKISCAQCGSSLSQQEVRVLGGEETFAK